MKKNFIIKNIVIGIIILFIGAIVLPNTANVAKAE